jgi:hypothetical protein
MITIELILIDRGRYSAFSIGCVPIFCIVRIKVLPKHTLFLLLVDDVSNRVDHNCHLFKVFTVKLVIATRHDTFYNICLSRSNSRFVFGSFWLLLEYFMVDMLETIEDKSSVVIRRFAFTMQ